MFGLLLPSALDHYQMEIQNNMLAKYQYMLSVPVSVMGGSNKLESMLDMLLFHVIRKRIMKMRKNSVPIH